MAVFRGQCGCCRLLCRHHVGDPLTPRHLCGRNYQRKFPGDLRSQVRAHTPKSASVRAGCHSAKLVTQVLTPLPWFRLYDPVPNMAIPTAPQSAPTLSASCVGLSPLSRSDTQACRSPSNGVFSASFSTVAEAGELLNEGPFVPGLFSHAASVLHAFTVAAWTENDGDD